MHTGDQERICNSLSKILLNGQSFKDGCSRTRQTEYWNETGKSTSAKTRFCVFSWKSLQKRIQGLFIFSAVTLYQEQSGVENSTRPCPQLGKSCSLPIPRTGPNAHFWGRGDALPVCERQCKDNMDDFKL